MPAFNTFIKEKAKELEEETIKVRHYLHEKPELSCEEYETVEFLKAEIEKIGLEIEKVPDSTGFTVLLDSGNPGKTLGIRADLDALPIEENENNLNGKRIVVSKKDGVMHACGHDGHMAILLSTMKILYEMRSSLAGKIYFIFEAGEEIGGGIEQMVNHLQNKEIDAIYGNHVASFLKSGKVSVDSGPKMAGAARVNFNVLGKSGHGSRPDLAVNPIFGAAQILTGITNAWANRLDVTKTVTLGLTQIHGGTADNIIPDKVNIRGSLRFFDTDEVEKAINIIKKVAEGTVKAHECQVEFGDNFGVVGTPVINDEHLAQIAEKGLEEILPGANEKGVQWFASEPFRRYRELAPIIFAFIGIGNDEFGSGAEHHNDKFDIDDNALINGVLTTTKFAIDYLNN